MAVKIVTAVARIVSTVMLISVAALALLLFGCKIFGLAPYTVLTGSMEPTYHVGSLIYVVSAKPEDVKVGEAITFKGDGLPATHRVVEIDPENRCFYTKGDANDNVDAPVSFEYLVGKPVFTVPYLGYFAGWIASAAGKWTAVAFLAAFFALLCIPDLLRKPAGTDGQDGDLPD